MKCICRIKTWYCLELPLDVVLPTIICIKSVDIQCQGILDFPPKSTNLMLKPRINPGIFLYKCLITLFGGSDFEIATLDAEETKWEYTGAKLSKHFISGSSGLVKWFHFYAEYIRNICKLHCFEIKFKICLISTTNTLNKIFLQNLKQKWNKHDQHIK